MKRNFLLLVLVKITSTSFAQTFGMINQYSGTIGKSSVAATIRIVDTTITGSYYYSKIGDLLYLMGSVHGEKTNIAEVTDDTITGRMAGTVTPDLSGWKGSWTGNGKTFPYEFHWTISAGSASLGVVNKDFCYVWRRNKSGDTLGPRMSSSVCYVKDCGNNEVRKTINELLLDADLKIDATDSDLRNAAVALMEDDFSSLSEDFDTAFATISKEDENWMDESPFIYKWEQETTWEVLFNEQYMLTVRALYYEFTGGAHGNYGYSNIVFSLKNGKQLTLDDIFKPGYQKQLTSIALSQLERQFKVASVDALAEQGFFLENGFDLNDNFFIQKNGIGFTYNPYEIAAYAVGAVDIFIPWSLIQMWIKIDGPMALVIKK